MRRLISSGNPLEAAVGYSRAVVQGDWCFVAGTTGRDPATGVVPGDAAAQARVALGIIGRALDDGGFGLGDVVRLTVYVTDVAFVDAVGAVLGESFGAIRPAATMVVVAALWVEIEATAYRG
ncbi:RidA family protein [Sandaracinobacteroides saxicola]|uniref:RidA family protein n=1 Tax=Sandaracinobacteroides saxicola TaxID=2759707 RepID=A0A7G5IKP2_9SPHN|nr:RidA family protein [Sandaracinobacteroides saxicola]QMW23934.1 RidA family protein [Sandaracinobacteroides saxicola]